MLDPDDLLATARGRGDTHDFGDTDFGDTDFGDTDFRAGLHRLVRSLNEEARLSETGALILEAQITRSLTTRLEVERWHRSHPGLADATVDEPVFVVGLPRTGTTLLSYLLDTDPSNRSLLRGEAYTPVPPLTTATIRTDPRLATADAEQEALYEVAPGFKAVHHETGAGPTECVTLLGQDFKSFHWETLANIPTYGYWFQDCDMLPAYEWHRRVLQVLQSEAPGRWCLKSPMHNLALDALVTVYPDARFVVTHRDPATVLASLCQLVYILSGLGTDHDFRSYIGRRWLELIATSVDRALAFRRRVGDERFLDIDYRDLARSPVETVSSVYGWLGWSWDRQTERPMADYVEANPKNTHGSHHYDLGDFDLAPEQVDERFADYRERFAGMVDRD